MNRIDVTHAADIRAIMGASGTGKSYYTKAELAKAKRALVWDMEDEYESLQSINLSELPALLSKRGSFKFRFVPSADKSVRERQFDLFCRIALACGNLSLFVEELRFVTEPSRAPAGWAGITLRGRKRGIKIIGTSQRPASIDKDFLSNATVIRCGALGYPADRAAVSAVIGCDPAEIAALTGHQAINWTRTPRKIWKTA
jgi:hypothetical protein